MQSTDARAQSLSKLTVLLCNSGTELFKIKHDSQYQRDAYLRESIWQAQHATSHDCSNEIECSASVITLSARIARARSYHLWCFCKVSSAHTTIVIAIAASWHQSTQCRAANTAVAEVQDDCSICIEL